MTEQDFSAFQQRLTALAALCIGKPLAVEVLKLYWAALKQLSLDELDQAISQIVQTHTYATMPLPAEFLRIARPPEDADVLAIQAFKEFEELIRDHNYYDSIQVEDPALACTIDRLGGWMRICEETRSMSDFDYGQFERDFKRCWAFAYRQREIPRKTYFAGYHETHNSEIGYRQQPFPLITVGGPGERLKLPADQKQIAE